MEPPSVTSSPDGLSGASVFNGTRVPVQALIDCLEGGETSALTVALPGRFLDAKSEQCQR